MTAAVTTADDGDALRRGRRRVGLLTLGLALACVPVSWWLAEQAGEADVASVVLIGVLFLLFELVTVDFEYRHESQVLTFISLPLVAGLLLLPPGIVVALRVATLVAVFAARRQPPYKLAFNACSAVLDAFVAAAIIVTFVPDGPLRWTSWPVVFAAVFAGDAVSTLTTTAAISCFQGRWEPPTLTDLRVGAIVAGADVVIAVVAVTLVQRRLPAAFLVLVIVGILLGGTRAYARVSTRYRGTLLLDRFTRALGSAVRDGTVLQSLLTEAADILHAEHAWLVVRTGGSTIRLHVEDGEIVSRPSAPIDDLLLTGLGDTAQLLGSDAPFDEALQADGLDEAIAARLAAPAGSSYVIAVAERSGEVRRFDADDVSVFATLAVHAGLALQNRDLVDRLRREIDVTEHLATHDTLTGLPNRMRFQQQVDSHLATSRDASVVLIDLDRFKEVNDTLGHHNGDALLAEVGRRLTDVADGAVVARLGGDEFAVLLTGSDESAAVAAARRLLESLASAAFTLEGIPVDVSASAGVATTSALAEDGATLLRHADVAMYLAKETHRSVEVYTPESDHYSPQRLALVGRLRTAIDERRLTLSYQPQIDLATDTVIGVEALVRWPQPGRVPIPPDDFIYIAEHTGLIHPLTQFVLEEAIAQASRWHADGRELRTSVNLSAHNLTRAEIVDEIARLLELGGLPPSNLMVELTETAVMTNPQKSVEVMEALRSIGVAIAIDDFGVGQSSLAYLTGVPADEIKIDKSFVNAMGSDPAAETIVGTIVDLGRNLGLEVVAEGVETESHATTLRAMRCASAQGYFYSRPLEVRGFELWLEHRESTAREPGRTNV